MEEYHQLVRNTLLNGTYKPNRTGVDTIADFGYSYKIDISEGYPLLTTKDMSGGRWESLVHEFLWYLSGDHHIQELREHTGIWDKWATDGALETAYGRFWRQYPAPQEEHKLQGENWMDGSEEWANEDGTIDQLEYVVNLLNNGRHHSRRLVVSAWHPANATTSLLPPCHFTYVCNVQDGKLNVHLTQRSGDIAVGIPFNIASYALLTRLLAKQTGFDVGEFHHTIVDAHIYCGGSERGEWYSNNLSTVQDLLVDQGPQDALDFILQEAPEEENLHEDHIPNLLRQLLREPREWPSLTLSEDVTIDNITRDNVELSDYHPHPSLQFYVAE